MKKINKKSGYFFLLNHDFWWSPATKHYCLAQGDNMSADPSKQLYKLSRNTANPNPNNGRKHVTQISTEDF
jgi:hypothetical protein